MNKKLLVYLSLNFIMLNNIYAENVYEYTDSSGRTVFTNKPTKNAKKVNLPPISVYSSPVLSTYNGKSYLTPKNNNVKTIYPKNTQANTTYQYTGTNENGRKQILTSELASEKLALIDAQQALQEGKKVKLTSEKTNNLDYQKRIQALEDSITEHQKNIQILNKQLGNN